MDMQAKPKSLSDRLMYSVGLLLIAIGTAILVLSIVPSLYDWTRMTGWTAEPATLIHAKLEAKADGQGDAHRVIGNYRYSYIGRSYVGHRMGIDILSDKFGDWHKSTYDALHADNIKVWVNPSRPQEAIFDRSMRWGLLLMKLLLTLIFGGLGFVVLWVLKNPRERTLPIETLVTTTE